MHNDLCIYTYNWNLISFVTIAQFKLFLNIKKHQTGFLVHSCYIFFNTPKR